MTADDVSFMAVAVAMARRGLGQVWPNPAVGALVVAVGSEPEIIARGWTMPGGRPHAETVVLARAGARSRGATLYVTLEPCAHHGRTPPCADAVAQAGIGRVVYGIVDPDPRVSGRGLQRLRAAGIEVAAGGLEEAVRRVTRGHLTRVTQGRPAVTLKLAVGSDGLVARGDGAPAWVTDAQARALGHLMRARADAILVGRGTVIADNPELTCRLPGLAGRSPVRVILDSQARVPPAAKLLRDIAAAPVWILCSLRAPGSARAALAARGAEVIPVESGAGGGLDLQRVAEALAARGVTRVLVEGGPSVARSLLDAGLVDEAVIFQGSGQAGPQGLQPFVDRGLQRLEDEGFRLTGRRAMGDAVVAYFER